MKTVDIKGKPYVTVNERLKEFRKTYPLFSLRTEIIVADSEQALIKAVIRTEDDRVLAEGTAFETADSSFINKTSHIENAETSAWGRALGNFGIGIDASVATADEVANAIANQDKPRTRQESNKASTGDVVRITKLCTETETELKKLYEHFGVVNVPTKEQAKKIILSLEKKLSDQIDSQVGA